jgi:hypothetical protein
LLLSADQSHEGSWVSPRGSQVIDTAVWWGWFEGVGEGSSYIHPPAVLGMFREESRVWGVQRDGSSLAVYPSWETFQLSGVQVEGHEIRDCCGYLEREVFKVFHKVLVRAWRVGSYGGEELVCRGPGAEFYSHDDPKQLEGEEHGCGPL